MPRGWDQRDGDSQKTPLIFHPKILEIDIVGNAGS